MRPFRLPNSGRLSRELSRLTFIGGELLDAAQREPSPWPTAVPPALARLGVSVADFTGFLILRDEFHRCWMPTTAAELRLVDRLVQYIWLALEWMRLFRLTDAIIGDAHGPEESPGKRTPPFGEFIDETKVALDVLKRIMEREQRISQAVRNRDESRRAAGNRRPPPG